MPQIIPGYYDTTGAMEVLKVTRAGVSKIAKTEGWPSYKSGKGHLFHATDVHEYRNHQSRRDLVTALGWKGRGLYRKDEIDINCPNCGRFAVEWPAPPALPKTYLCLNGHKGELNNDIVFEIASSGASAANDERTVEADNEKIAQRYKDAVVL